MKKLDLNKAVEQYKDLANQIALLEVQKDVLADRFKQVMGESEELCVGSHVVRYKTIISNRFDTAGFKKAHADMYADFLKTSTNRRFTIA
jgi:Phage-related protein, predicted endonuclease